MHDAHCHLFDLSKKADDFENIRRILNIPVLTNSYCGEDFDFNKKLKKDAARDKAAGVFISFGVHPQLLAVNKNEASASFDMLLTLINQHEINAIGECGFDLFDEKNKQFEKEQEELFVCEIELAKTNKLPLLLHLRKAMHKVFYYKKELKKLKAVIFHSYSGTDNEAFSLINFGINAYFSFGNQLLNNHKKAQRAAARLPSERILFETDAPYQPAKGRAYSNFDDISCIIEKAAGLRKDAGSACCDLDVLEKQTDENFFNIFRT